MVVPAESKESSKTDAGYPLGIGVRNSLIALGVISVLGFFCTFLMPETKGRSLEKYPARMKNKKLVDQCRVVVEESCNFDGAFPFLSSGCL
ncbi:hypothetical protein K1719_045582 [Acacia pycnantha]|nr:hypothetical protein K1719_045582 [Acacia pycnantha]